MPTVTAPSRFPDTTTPTRSGGEPAEDAFAGARSTRPSGVHDTKGFESSASGSIVISCDAAARASRSCHAADELGAATPRSSGYGPAAAAPEASSQRLRPRARRTSRRRPESESYRRQRRQGPVILSGPTRTVGEVELSSSEVGSVGAVGCGVVGVDVREPELWTASASGAEERFITEHLVRGQREDPICRADDLAAFVEKLITNVVSHPVRGVVVQPESDPRRGRLARLAGILHPVHIVDRMQIAPARRSTDRHVLAIR